MRTSHIIDAYVAELFRQVIRRLGARRVHDADDIAQRVCEAFLKRPDDLMQRYPQPATLAAAVAANAAISHDRNQRAQRGDGVALDEDRDGTLRPRRPYLSGDAPIGGTDGSAQSGRMFDRVTDRSEAHDDRVVRQMLADEVLEQCLAGLSSADRELLRRVDGEGIPVQQIALEQGLARETVSRRVNRIRRFVQQNGARSTPSDWEQATSAVLPVRPRKPADRRPMLTLTTESDTRSSTVSSTVSHIGPIA